MTKQKFPSLVTVSFSKTVTSLCESFLGLHWMMTAVDEAAKAKLALE